MGKIKGISKKIDGMNYEDIQNLAKTQKLKTTSKRKSHIGVGKKKKNVCICCGARKPEYVCERCGRTICLNHMVFVDIGMTLSQRSRLRLTKFKDHPAFFLCLDDNGKGCAKPVVKAMLKEIK